MTDDFIFGLADAILGWSLFIGIPMLIGGLLFPGDRAAQWGLVLVGTALMILFWKPRR